MNVLQLIVEFNRWLKIYYFELL